MSAEVCCAPMSATLRLFAIEARRSSGLWTLPVIVVAASVLARNDLAMGVLLWTESSVLVRDTVIFAGPLVAGAAAWMAMRDRQRGLEELLTTVPTPGAPRHITVWAATTLWAVAGYVVIGAYIFAMTAREATWGGPTWWPVAIGLLAIPAYAAIGYASGIYIPVRFTGPLVAIALFALQIAVGLIAPGFIETEWFIFLSPVARLQTPVWFGVLPHVGLPQSFFLLGITVLALGSIAIRFRSRSRLPASLALLTGIALILIAIFMLVDIERQSVHSMYDPANFAVIPYERICQGQHLPVCIHPAYAPFLEELSTAADGMAEPLVGLSGLPRQVLHWTLLPDETPIGPQDIPITLLTFSWTPYNTAYEIAYHLVSESGRVETDAQAALRAWLLRRAGREIHCQPGGDRSLSIVGIDRCEAADRFEALGAAEQRAWLEANYKALRTGEVETLP